MSEIISIDCGQHIDLIDEDTVDYDSGGTDGRFKPNQNYVLYANCPIDSSVHIDLKVPKEINLFNVRSYKKAVNLILSGTIYSCNFRGTIKCPLTPKKS